MNRDWLEKDFYTTLGVDKTASADQIKKAYRRLAQKHHPDANPGDAAAEEKFKEISEAYATLSNPEQRKEYDQVRRMAASGGFPGFGGMRGGGFGTAAGQRVRVEDLEDLLGGFGGIGDLFDFGGRRGTSSGPTRGADIHANLTIHFEEAAHGTTTEITVDGAAPCSRCGGTGAEPGSHVVTCPTCGGRGIVAQNQGFFSFSQPCPQCQGSGRLVENPCTKCGGRGTENRRRRIKVKVPAGVKDGATLRLRGKGGPGSPRGDVLVNVNVAASRTFGRKGNDLILTVPISYTEATLGTKLSVPTLNGEVKLRIPAGTSSGKTFRVRGQGIKPSQGKGGDLLVTVQVAVPQKLSKEERKLLEELSGHETGDLRSHLEG